MSDLPQIQFTRGVPATESFPVEQMAAAAEQAVSKYGPTILQYGKSSGFAPLREWIANWFKVSPEQILISNGSLQIVEFLCYHFLKPGDLVMTEAPSYDRCLALFRRHQANIVDIPLQPDGIDLAVLEATLKKQVPKFFYIIPDFQNPAGATYSLEKRQRVLELAEQYDFWILEDAPYRPLRYQGQPVPSLFELNPTRVLHLLSFSKLIGPGPRVGFVIADEAMLKSVAKIAEDTYITPVLLGQGIIYEFLNQGLLTPQIETLKSLYAIRLEATLNALDKHLPDAQATRPEGGFFLSITLPAGVTTQAVRDRARSYNLILADGEAFFANGGGERFLRLPYCALTPAELDDGVTRLAAAVKDLL